MKKPLQTFLLLTYLSFSGLFLPRHSAMGAEAGTYAQGWTSASAYTSASLVIATEYCAFLNQTAAADPDHLYDEAMSTDLESACIVRVGAPGRWHYEVI
ncbi:MAG: hypothetical protein ACH346_04455, partial [Chthoniobacterales bacterium]